LPSKVPPAAWAVSSSTGMPCAQAMAMISFMQAWAPHMCTGYDAFGLVGDLGFSDHRGPCTGNRQSRRIPGGTGLEDGLPGGHKGKALGDHLVTRSHAHGGQGHLHGRAAAELTARAKLAPVYLAKGLFKLALPATHAWRWSAELIAEQNLALHHISYRSAVPLHPTIQIQAWHALLYFSCGSKPRSLLRTLIPGYPAACGG
jgi:hypothetical protein